VTTTSAETEIVLTTEHPVAQCVDLKATFGRSFRYAMDPAYAVERSEFRAIEKPWLTRIPCRFGFIAVHGGRRLSAYATTRRRALAALSCVTVAQQGDGEVLVTFDVTDLPVVAELLVARRPPRLSPEEQARRRDRMLALRAARKAGPVSALETAIPA